MKGTFRSGRVLGVLFLALECISSTDVSKCTNGAPLPPLVEVGGCASQPCTFLLGRETTMTMRFRSPRYLEKMHPNAVGFALGLRVDYPLNQTDACEGITNTPCPLAAGEYVEYSYGMLISDKFPQIPVTFEFSLVDEDQNDTFECFRLDIALKSGIVPPLR